MKQEFFLEDLIPCLMTAHIKLDLNFVCNLLKNASNADVPWRNKLFCKQIDCPVNAIKKSSTTVYGWYKGYKTIPFNKLVKIIALSTYSWKDIENNLIYLKAGIRKGEIQPKFPIRIDSKLGSICGHIMGDGSIEKRFHSVFFSNSDPFLIKEFYNYMQDVFGTPGRIWLQDKPEYNNTKWLKRIYDLKEMNAKNNAGVFYPKICSDILYSLLGRFAEGDNKLITSEIKNGYMEFKRAFIRAFFDDEGSVNIESQTLRFHQDRKDILEDIRIMLLEFGIKSNPVRISFKKGKSHYYFNICSLENYSKFKELIGCTSPKKINNLSILIQNTRNSKRYNNFNGF